MANDFYQPTGWPITGGSVSSSQARAEFTQIEKGFDKMPTLTGKANLPVAVNTGGTALESTAKATAQQNLGLEPGVDVQVYSAILTALGTVSNTLNEVPYVTNDDPITWSSLTCHDEDNMTSNDALGLATQQSIKAYADTQFSTLAGTLAGAQNDAAYFYNAAAPTGWTIVTGTSYNNRAVQLGSSVATYGTNRWDIASTGSTNSNDHWHYCQATGYTGESIGTSSIVDVYGGSIELAAYPHTHDATSAAFLSQLPSGNASHDHDWPAVKGVYCIVADKD